MKVLVCLKQVPHPDYFSKISYDPTTKNILREGIPAVINPLDRHAIEEGLRLREHLSGQVTVLSMGPPQARSALEEALSMGADRAFLLCDRAFGGADTLATAFTLSAGISKLGAFDLILCGNETADGATAQVPPQLAEFLNIPHIVGVRKLEVAGGGVVAQRVFERGYIRLRAALPCLVAVVQGVNHPRLPTVRGIIEAASKELVVWGLTDLGLPAEKVGLPGSAIRVADVVALSSGRHREVFSGDPAGAVKQAVKRLVELEAL